MTCLALAAGFALGLNKRGDKASGSYLPQIETAHYGCTVSGCVSIFRPELCWAPVTKVRTQSAFINIDVATLKASTLAKITACPDHWYQCVVSKLWHHSYRFSSNWETLYSGGERIFAVLLTWIMHFILIQSSLAASPVMEIKAVIVWLGGQRGRHEPFSGLLKEKHAGETAGCTAASLSVLFKTWNPSCRKSHSTQNKSRFHTRRFKKSTKTRRHSL